MKLKITAYKLAERFIGTTEILGNMHNPHIIAMLKLDSKWPDGDEVPWCSAFINYICWLLRLPRSKSLMARSWLEVGKPIHMIQAKPGFDVVILKRGKDQPGPEVTSAPGHVGFYAGEVDNHILLLGGNQSNQVNVTPYDTHRVLGFRRLL